MAGTLYVVSTPIGNLDDMTVRAVATLKSAGLVAAEDTRRTGQLLRHFGITTPTTSLHAHNESGKASMILEKLSEGIDVALVSDAGTPLVSDPGQRLVASATSQGIRVVPIPGPSAVMAALAASGYPADEFVFAGFAPSRSQDRKHWLRQLQVERRTIVFFETPHRISKTLGDIARLFGERPITVARELTKLHEQVIHTVASSLPDLKIPERGEFTLVFAPFEAQAGHHEPIDDSELVRFFCQTTNNGALSRRQALSQTAKKFGLTPNDVYARLERVKASGPS